MLRPGAYLLTSLTVIVGNQILGFFSDACCVTTANSNNDNNNNNNNNKKQKRKKKKNSTKKKKNSTPCLPFLSYIFDMSQLNLWDVFVKVHSTGFNSFTELIVAVHGLRTCLGASACQRNNVTKHFRYLKWRNPYLCKLYVRLMKGKTHPQNSLVRCSTSVLGTWRFCWTYKLPPICFGMKIKLESHIAKIRLFLRNTHI